MATQECEDGHKCRNGSKCTPHPDFPDKFTCDCANNEAGAVYAGISCDHLATTFCNEDEEANGESFCTNGGFCRKYLDDVGYHAGCDCLPGYTGDYCEFTEGQKVPDYLSPKQLSGGGSDKNTALVASLSAIGALCAVGIVIAVMIFKKRQDHGVIHEQTSPRSIRHADSSQLDADGEVLKNSFAAESGEMYSSPVNSRDSMRRSLDPDVDVTEQVEIGEEGSY